MANDGTTTPLEFHPYGPHCDEGRVETIAKTPLSILIYGETGTGKEVMAQRLHRLSGRGPFVAVNCAAIPETLIESELFGHKRGSFTGAVGDHKGFVEEANGGTLFLDEITEMPVGMQTRLLRVLQEREVRRVGDSKTTHVDIRVISATNRKPEEAIRVGKLREDLYYRLNQTSLSLPPLRSQKEQIVPLARFFAGQAAQAEKKDVRLTPEAEDLLQTCSWPGNIRQLQSTMQVAFYLASERDGSREITPETLRQTTVFSSPAEGEAKPALEDEDILAALSAKTMPEIKALLKEGSRRSLIRALKEAGAQNQPRPMEYAAGLLNVSRSNVHSLVKEHGISVLDMGIVKRSRVSHRQGQRDADAAAASAPALSDGVSVRRPPSQG
jgi:transcriptional regulator with PAS, ATPase and Fis domain